MTTDTVIRIALLTTLALAGTSCGLKGNLYLPDSSTEMQQPPSGIDTVEEEDDAAQDEIVDD